MSNRGDPPIGVDDRGCWCFSCSKDSRQVILAVAALLLELFSPSHPYQRRSPPLSEPERMQDRGYQTRVMIKCLFFSKLIPFFLPFFFSISRNLRCLLLEDPGTTTYPPRTTYPCQGRMRTTLHQKKWKRMPKPIHGLLFSRDSTSLSTNNRKLARLN